MTAQPEEWGSADQLDGLELVDKHTLKGVPFRITAVTFATNQRGVSYVYVDGENLLGEPFSFNDSSSGVRAQIVAYLTSKGQDSAVDTGITVPVSLVIPRGLRISEFEVQDEKNRSKMARTFYLTTSGKRPAPVPASTRKTAAK